MFVGLGFLMNPSAAFYYAWVRVNLVGLKVESVDPSDSVDSVAFLGLIFCFRSGVKAGLW